MKDKEEEGAGIIERETYVGVAGLGINRGRLRSLWRSFDLCSSSSCLLFDMRVSEVIRRSSGGALGSAPTWALNLLLTSRAGSLVCRGTVEARQTKKLKMAVYRGNTLLFFGNAAHRRSRQIDLKG